MAVKIIDEAIYSIKDRSFFSKEEVINILLEIRSEIKKEQDARADVHSD